MKYICDVCGYEYDEALGDPDHGIAPGTKWALANHLLKGASKTP